MAPRRLDYLIESKWEGHPVHDLLRRQLELSGTLLRRIKWLEDGILLDGQRVHTRVLVRTGQLLSVRVSDPGAPSGIPPVSLPLDIVYEDRDITVVNKAPSMPSHPGPGHWQDSLGNALMHHWSLSDPEADFHPVHRLDKGTSGLMVTAKHPYAQDQLRLQLHTEGFHREYLAVCQGRVPSGSGTIDIPIGRCEDSILKRQAGWHLPDSQRAVTHYRCLWQDESLSLVALTLETGRTHQIRVHMSWLGHPLLGDFLYGEEDRLRLARPALHSWRLSFLHPVTKEGHRFLQPLPEDLLRLLPSEAASNDAFTAFCQG